MEVILAFDKMSSELIPFNLYILLLQK